MYMHMTCTCTDECDSMLTRCVPARSQLSVMLSVLNLLYKLTVVWSAISLAHSFTGREELIKQMEIEAGQGGATSASSAITSTGEPVDSRSLAAQEGS